MRDIDNFKEADVTLDGKLSSDESVKKLWAKNELIFRNLAALNLPLIKTGKQCMDFALGKIFDDATRKTYEEVQNKICIEPRILKQRINAAVGRLMQARRKGKVVSEGTKDANEIYAANTLLKFIEKEIKEQFLITKMLFNGCITGYPQFLVLDQAVTAYNDPMCGAYATVLPWDSAVCNKLEHSDGEDLTDLIYICRKTKDELIDENPDREADIKDHFDRRMEHGYGASLDTVEGLSIEDARNLSYDVITGASNFMVDGKLLCLNRFSIQKVSAEVAIKEDDSVTDYQLLPPKWSVSRKAEWRKAHPEYKYVKKDTKIAWVSRWTSDGLTLMNEPHWFQETDNKGNPILPVSVFIPQIIDGMPTGPGPDDRLLVLMKAIAETEQLHDVRTGSGDVLAYKQGAIVNSDELPTELSIGNGIVQVDPDEVPGDIESAIKFMKRTPNTTYGEYSQRVDTMLDNTDGMSAAVRGNVVSDRVSGRSREADAAATAVGYSIIAENMNKTIERLKNLECMMIPYTFTQPQVVQVYDDDRGEELAMTVNETEYDANGDPSIVANDLTSCKWRWRLVEGDDSPTAKQAELNEMLIFWNTTAPVLIEADETLMTLASVLMSMGNKMAQQVGRVIAQKAEVNAQQLSQQQMMETMATVAEKKAKADAETTKAKRAGFSFSITPDDLAQIPGLYKVLVDSQYINQNQMFQLPPPGGQNVQVPQPAM
jgi:hypothetical protein